MSRPAPLASCRLLALSSAAFAETRDERFRRIDVDRDGVISHDEHSGNVEAEFRKLDTDGDGAVTVEDYAAELGRKTPGAPRVALLSVARCFFRIVDGNGDGKLSLAEMRSFEDRIFKWLAGSDGRMTLEESEQGPPPEVIPVPVCN
ncbi:EF-hand domain-containing protein [Bosea psychrotolerans]|uniref:EF hand domain-containing protein n=1 Tax=Bosea psychrotolerans TaxID=1871628 RepID=A0A2S4MP95_9HYPH|nr:EF-hand domain-containing protein [Bosea psychrotolerans]POR56521.1 EF hand domain-containing protein [Bosea psychrotolerans]